MKIPCHCGALIIDQSDELPHKGRLIPDQEWSALLDALDRDVIEPVAARRLDSDAASHAARTIVIRSSREMWQCRLCGRLYIDGHDGRLQSFVPENEQTQRDVLRGRGE